LTSTLCASYVGHIFQVWLTTYAFFAQSAEMYQVEVVSVQSSCFITETSQWIFSNFLLGI